jgi:acylphosphatase
MNIAKRYFVSGRVQGVCFRASARKEAERLGVAGWAINLPDGRVEVLAVGASTAVQELEEWLYAGPPLANVLAVDSAPADAAELAASGGFSCG